MERLEEGEEPLRGGGLGNSNGFRGNGTWSRAALGGSSSSLMGILSQMRDLLLACLSPLIGLISGFISSNKAPEVVKLNGKRLTLLKQLGEGGFSFVYLVREDGNYEDLKALKRVRVQLPEQETRLLQEINAHRSVSSKHVIPLLDSLVVKDGNGIAKEGLLLLPYHKKGTVQDLIDRTPFHEFIPISTILRIAVGVCKGLQAFHALNPPLAFRDLKPANILLDAQGEAVLMDLGSVTEARLQLKSRREAISLQDLCAETVTAPFRPPELFDPPSHGLIDESTDVWSLGCTIYAMAFRQSPFDGSMTASVSGKVQFPTSNNPYDSSFCSFIEWIIQADPNKRPSVQQIQSWCESALTTLASNESGYK